MFTLPDILFPKQKKEFLPFFYLHVSDDSTKSSRLNFTRPCISIILAGEKRIFGDNKYDSFRQGDLILFKPGNYLGYEVIEGNENYASLMIFFDLKKMGHCQKRVTENKFELHRADDYLYHFGRSCQLLFQDNSVKSEEPLHAVKFQELAQYLSFKKMDLFSFFYSGQGGPTTDDLKECIERYWNSTLSLDEIAFLCNMSLSSFKRNFEKIYRESPGKWLKQKRLEQAAEQIKLFNRNPTEVYFETGYADYSSFSYSFKKQFGVSPKEYRQLRS